jgi:hypothetical protein
MPRKGAGVAVGGGGGEGEGELLLPWTGVVMALWQARI